MFTKNVFCCWAGTILQQAQQPRCKSTHSPKVPPNLGNIFLFFTSFLLLIGCGETCYMPPELYFKPINQGGQVIIGSKGVYSIDSMKLVSLQINGNDTTYIDKTNTFEFYKGDSLLSISLPSDGVKVMYLAYSYEDNDTLIFEIIQNKKNKPTCTDVIFKYNGKIICNNCNLENIHTIVK